MLHLKSEMARVKIDLKAMQEKADILQEENVKLRENLREAKASGRCAIILYDNKNNNNN